MGADQGGKPVGDDDYRPPLGDSVEIGQKNGFGFRVQGAGGLVQDQNPRLRQQGAGDGEVLFLSAREVGAVFFQDRVVALGQALDELLSTRDARRLDDFLEACRWFGHGKILPDRAAKEEIPL